jgi:hypothetical protein
MLTAAVGREEAVVAYKETVERIRLLAPENAFLFAAGCVHRVAPVVHACATESTSRLFGELSELLWETGTEDRKAELVDLLEDAPEFAAESSEEKEYWAHHALALTLDAVQSSNPDEALERCDSCCALALNISSDFDAVMTEYPGGPETQLPPAGPHEQLEATAQSQSLDILSSGLSVTESAHRIRELSAPAAERFSADMDEFFRRSGWTR